MIYMGEDIHSLNRQDFVRQIIAKMIKAGRAVPPEMAKILRGGPLEIAEVAPVEAYINHGRWVADCPFCPGAEIVWREDATFFCLSCFNEQADFRCVPIAFPLNAGEIENILERRPVAATRNWLPHETAKALRDENRREGVN